MTKERMLLRLKVLKVKKAFKPILEFAAGTIILQTRKQAEIVDGRLKGSGIALMTDIFKVWTPRKIKAKAVAVKYGIKVRLLDNEAELFVPVELADEILPAFGAKVKRTCNEAKKRVLQLARNVRSLSRKHCRNGGSEV